MLQRHNIRYDFYVLDYNLQMRSTTRNNTVNTTYQWQQCTATWSKYEAKSGMHTGYKSCKL